MKVGFQYGIAGYTGKSDGLVYCYNKLLGNVYARKRVYPRLTAENERVGTISGNLFAIKPSDGYKKNMYFYLMQYKTLRNANRRLVTWSNLYIKLMYEMAKADPSIDLRTLTREEIYLRDLPCISVKKAVEAGLLPKVLEWEGYLNQI